MFPLTRNPGAIVLVDDSSQFLESLADALPSEWNLLTFASPKEFTDFMEKSARLLADMDTFHQGAISRYKKTGKVVIEALRYWNTFPERFSLPQVAIVDYYMPSMTGLDALATCKEWAGARILLTGMADEKTVTKAFNEGRIDRYIPKQTPFLAKEIKKNVNELVDNFSDAHWQSWNAWYMSLQTDQKLILRFPEVAQHLNEALQGGYEHVAIGAPFGVLALGQTGDLKWIQLERTSSLDDSADLAQQMGVSHDDVSGIRAGKLISDAAFLRANADESPVQVKPADFQVKIPFISEVLTGASFAVGTSGAPPADMCFGAWLSRQPPRIGY